MNNPDKPTTLLWLFLFNISLNHLTSVIFWCNIHSIKQRYLEVNYYVLFKQHLQQNPKEI